MKILVTGGSGLLGTEIIKILQRKGLNYATPTHDELDITSFSDVAEWGRKIDPDVVVHLAAFTGVSKAEEPGNHWMAYLTNVIGTRNVSTLPGKLVYVSTDYVFNGKKGFYQEYDPPKPCNFYGWTKLLGEYMVQRSGNNYLIVRTSFCDPHGWPYPKAFADQWTSREPVDKIAPQIVEAALNLEGIIHIGGPRKSVLTLAQSIDPSVEPCSRSDVTDVTLPRDTSFNTLMWEGYRRQEGLIES